MSKYKIFCTDVISKDLDEKWFLRNCGHEFLLGLSFSNIETRLQLLYLPMMGHDSSRILKPDTLMIPLLDKGTFRRAVQNALD